MFSIRKAEILFVLFLFFLAFTIDWPLNLVILAIGGLAIVIAEILISKVDNYLLADLLFEDRVITFYWVKVEDEGTVSIYKEAKGSPTAFLAFTAPITEPFELAVTDTPTNPIIVPASLSFQNRIIEFTLNKMFSACPCGSSEPNCIGHTYTGTFEQDDEHGYCKGLVSFYVAKARSGLITIMPSFELVTLEHFED